MLSSPSKAPRKRAQGDGVTVQLDKVEIHELRPKVLTEDKGGPVWRQTSN